MNDPWALEDAYQAIWTRWFPGRDALSPRDLTRLVDANMSAYEFERYCEQIRVSMMLRGGQ